MNENRNKRIKWKKESKQKHNRTIIKKERTKRNALFRSLAAAGCPFCANFLWFPLWCSVVCIFWLSFFVVVSFRAVLRPIYLFRSEFFFAVNADSLDGVCKIGLGICFTRTRLNLCISNRLLYILIHFPNARHFVDTILKPKRNTNQHRCATMIWHRGRGNSVGNDRSDGRKSCIEQAFSIRKYNTKQQTSSVSCHPTIHQYQRSVLSRTKPSWLNHRCHTHNRAGARRREKENENEWLSFYVLTSIYLSTAQ